MDWLAALGSLLMFLLLLSCSNNMFVCCFLVFQKESFSPTRDGSELMQGFLLHVFSSSIKSRFDPDFALFYFILCFFKEKW